MYGMQGRILTANFSVLTVLATPLRWNLRLRERKAHLVPVKTVIWSVHRCNDRRVVSSVHFSLQITGCDSRGLGILAQGYFLAATASKSDFRPKVNFICYSGTDKLYSHTRFYSFVVDFTSVVKSLPQIRLASGLLKDAQVKVLAVCFFYFSSFRFLVPDTLSRMSQFSTKWHRIQRHKRSISRRAQHQNKF